ncbi:hypothetical protein MXB_2697, partial [Myxobolus squamalis]
MFRDRTPEFSHIISRIKSQNIFKYQSPTPDNLLQRRSQFLEAAHYNQKYKHWGLHLLLCKNLSLFDDRTEEINELVYIIKLDVMHLKQQIEELTHVMSQENKGGTLHGINHRQSILTSLEKQLAHVSKDFKGILEVRTENCKIQKSRQENFSRDIVVPTLVNSNNIKSSDNLKYRSLSAHNLKGDSDVYLNMDQMSDENSQRLGHSDGKLEDQLLIVQEAERLNAVQTIESTIVELGGIFQQLAHLVNEQEEHVQRGYVAFKKWFRYRSTHGNASSTLQILT